VIARQITNDKVSQGLIGLKLTEQVSPGDQVIKDGKKIGKITSVIRSPTHGWIALVVIKRKHIKLGTLVKVESAIDQKEGILVQGRVVKLFFTSP